MSENFLERYFQAFVPQPLHAPALKNTSKLLAALSTQEYSELENILSNDSTLATLLIRCLIGSEYLLDACCREPSLLLHWLLTEVTHSSLSTARMSELITAFVYENQSIESLDISLRRFRRQIVLAIIWRDLNRLSSLEETTTMMASLAELCLRHAARFHFDQLVKEVGSPVGDETGSTQPFLIIGMGKLGANELNISSDIDLIFAFPEAGYTNHPKHAIDNQLFFTRLGQRLIKTLHTVTAEGFVFRVDMRLRPYGDSGALVYSLSALKHYYQTQGRDWERFAMVKASLVSSVLPTTDTNAGGSLTREASAATQSAEAQLKTILQSFTYRKYVDFSVVDALRRLKGLINQEIRRKGMWDDIKLGPGGIREVEFIVQALQLIRGGRDRQLRGQQLLPMLQQLKLLGFLDCEVTEQLVEAYIFLRNTEHALQAYRDEQTQRLPEDELGQERLAWVMGCDGWDRFSAKLQHYRRLVDKHFQWVVADPLKEQTVFTEQPEWTALWQNTLANENQFLQQQGFTQPQDTLNLLQKWRDKPSVLRMSATARERLDLLMPLLLSTVASTEAADSPDEILVSILGWLEKVVGRTAYMVLLLENPSTLIRLIQLCASSSWIADQLTQLPSLLDELLDSHNLHSLPDKASLRDDLRQQLMRIHSDDLETIMETLRYFRISNSLRTAASEVTGHLPLMKTSDYLTFLAEVILEQVLQLAWQTLISRYGAPDGDQNPHFVIVGYGKLGGLELGYDSDLDLVFIYQADPQGVTDGENTIDNQTFYTRMGQKIIHLLNTRMLSGQLYEIDMRLRPSGNSGLLVTSMQAFARYQSQSAWIWEHQALVRARVVAGYQPLAEEFHQVRQSILCQQRNLEELKTSIISMREKMRDHLSENNAQSQNKWFHLKQGVGGIVDIEFMVQYAVLAWSSQYPLLAEYTDNIRVLECLNKVGILQAEQAETLTEAYKHFRATWHRLALQQQKSMVVDAESYACQRNQVQSLWQFLLGAD